MTREEYEQEHGADSYDDERTEAYRCRGKCEYCELDIYGYDSYFIDKDNEVCVHKECLMDFLLAAFDVNDFAKAFDFIGFNQ